VQAFRKKSGLQKGDLIEAVILFDKKIIEKLKKHAEFLKERINAKKLEFGDASNELKEYKQISEDKIKGKVIKIGFNII